MAGDPVGAAALLNAAEKLVRGPVEAQVRCEMAEIRVLRLIRQGRFTECKAMSPEQLSASAY